MRKFIAFNLYVLAVCFTIGIVVAIVGLAAGPEGSIGNTTADTWFSLAILLVLGPLTWWGARKMWN